MLLLGIIVVAVMIAAVLLILMLTSATPEPPAVDLAAWQRELRAISRDHPASRFDREGGVR